MCSFMLICQCCFAIVKVLLKKATYLLTYLLSGVWGEAPAGIDVGAFYPLNLTSGGNNFNGFPANQLHKLQQIGMAPPYQISDAIPLPAPLSV